MVVQWACVCVLSEYVAYRCVRIVAHVSSPAQCPTSPDAAAAAAAVLLWALVCGGVSR